MWRGLHGYLGSEDPHAGSWRGEAFHVRPLWEDVFLQLSAAKAPAAGPQRQGCREGGACGGETEADRGETFQL